MSAAKVHIFQSVHLIIYRIGRKLKYEFYVFLLLLLLLLFFFSFLFSFFSFFFSSFFFSFFSSSSPSSPPSSSSSSFPSPSSPSSSPSSTPPPPSSSSQTAPQSNADFRLLDELLPVSSIYGPLFPVFNFASVNICLYTIPPSVFWSSS